ncbi:hypothetical protein CAAN1_21S01838 [[Candida] anglica]|uniref:Uncharacterized protein n=1 Tax=[Candida] anglica TaxID=148631 RepID=A0ABP0EE06_9ASCO
MDSLDSDRSGSNSPHVTATAMSLPATSALNQRRKRSVSVTSNSSAVAGPAHRMSIISLGSPRNSIVSVDDMLRTTTRNNSYASLSSLTSTAPAPATTLAATSSPHAMHQPPPAPQHLPSSMPPSITSTIPTTLHPLNYLQSTHISPPKTILSDDEDEVSEAERSFSIKENFQFKFDSLASMDGKPRKSTSPDSPLDLVGNPNYSNSSHHATKSAMGGTARTSNSTSSSPSTSLSLVPVVSPTASPVSLHGGNQLAKKSKQLNPSKTNLLPQSFLFKKKNLFSKDLQFEFLARNRRDFDSVLADSGATMSPHLTSTKSNGGITAATTESQNSLISKINRKWNHPALESVGPPAPDRKKKRSRADLEADADEPYD